MPVAFGFSVGDFINAIVLINKIRKALKHVGGAADDINFVLQDLEQLESLFLTLIDGQWGKGGDISYVNAVRGVANSCEATLAAFLHKVEGFQRFSTGSHFSSGRILGGLKQAKWTVQMTEEVDRFRLLILSKKATISLLLSMLLTSTLKGMDDEKVAMLDKITKQGNSLTIDIGECQLMIQKTHQEIEDIKTCTERTEATVAHVQDVSDCVTRLERSLEQAHKVSDQRLNNILQFQQRTLALIPSSLEDIMPSLLSIKDQFTAYMRIFTRYSADTLGMLKEIVHTNQKIYVLLQQCYAFSMNIERTLVGDKIIFSDVLGRNHSLDYCYFRSWQVFTAMLQFIFKDMPGERHVEYGQFLILDSRSGGRVIDSQQWERSVFPRSRLKMSVIMSKQGNDGRRCPKCNEPASEKCCSIQTLVHCTPCDLDYTAFRSITEASHGLKIGPEGRGNGESIKEIPMMEHIALKMVEDGLDIFKTIHIRNQQDNRAYCDFSSQQFSGIRYNREHNLRRHMNVVPPHREANLKRHMNVMPLNRSKDKGLEYDCEYTCGRAYNLPYANTASKITASTDHVYADGSLQEVGWDYYQNPPVSLSQKTMWGSKASSLMSNSDDNEIAFAKARPFHHPSFSALLTGTGRSVRKRQISRVQNRCECLAFGFSPPATHSSHFINSQ